MDPVGTFGWIADPIPVSVSRSILVAAIVVGAGFVAGWRYRVSGPLFAVLLLFALTACNLAGQVWHTENLLLMHVAVLAFAPVADVWVARRPPAAAPAGGGTLINGSAAAQLMSILTVRDLRRRGRHQAPERGLRMADGRRAP